MDGFTSSTSTPSPKACLKSPFRLNPRFRSAPGSRMPRPWSRATSGLGTSTPAVVHTRPPLNTPPYPPYRCVHLTMQLLVTSQAHNSASSRGLRSLLEHLFHGGQTEGAGSGGSRSGEARGRPSDGGDQPGSTSVASSPPAASFWRSGVFTAQLLGQVAVVEDGRVVTFVDYSRQSPRAGLSVGVKRGGTA